MSKAYPTPTEPVASKIPPERPSLCSSTWCLLGEGHPGECVSIPRKEQVPTAWGPGDPGWGKQKK